MDRNALKTHRETQLCVFRQKKSQLCITGHALHLFKETLEISGMKTTVQYRESANIGKDGASPYNNRTRPSRRSDRAIWYVGGFL